MSFRVFNWNMCHLIITENDQLWKLPEMSLNGLRRQVQQGMTEGSDWKKKIYYPYHSEFGGFNKLVIYILPDNYLIIK